MSCVSIVSLPSDRVDAVFGSSNFFLGVENMFQSLVGKMVAVKLMDSKRSPRGSRYNILVHAVSDNGISGDMLYEVSKGKWVLLDLPTGGGFVYWTELAFFRALQM